MSVDVDVANVDILGSSCNGFVDVKRCVTTITLLILFVSSNHPLSSPPQAYKGNEMLLQLYMPTNIHGMVSIYIKSVIIN
eukprot:c10495_g1_i1 orf=292-531(+)